MLSSVSSPAACETVDGLLGLADVDGVWQLNWNNNQTSSYWCCCETVNENSLNGSNASNEQQDIPNVPFDKSAEYHLIEGDEIISIQ